MWQLGFTEFTTTTGGPWRLAGCRDHWSKYELGWHVSPTGNQHDAIAAIELTLAEAERLAGRPLIDLAARDTDGNAVPLVTVVTDNGGPFRFEAFIATHPELRHVRTRVRSPERYGVDYNTVRPHEALFWNRPLEVHLGLADPKIPNFPEPEILPTA